MCYGKKQEKSTPQRWIILNISHFFTIDFAWTTVAQSYQHFIQHLSTMQFLLTTILVFLLVSSSSSLHCTVCPDQSESSCSYTVTQSVKAFPSSQLTFETWFWYGKGGHSSGLIEYQSQSTLGEMSRTFAVAITSTSILVTVQGQEVVVDIPSGFAKKIETESWTHLAVTWETTKAVLQVFVNGQPTSDFSAQLSSVKNMFMQSGGSLRLGRYNDTLSISPPDHYGHQDQNVMQEVRLWATALDERHISQTLRKTSMPSYTGIFAHWRLWGNSSSDLYDLAQSATGIDRSLTLVGTCVADASIGVISTAGTPGSMPGAYELMAYSYVPLLGLGMASGKQYALDVGNEIQISSFGDGNIVECTNGKKLFKGSISCIFLNKILHINISYLHIENFCSFFFNFLLFRTKNNITKSRHWNNGFDSRRRCN